MTGTLLLQKILEHGHIFPQDKQVLVVKGGQCELLLPVGHHVLEHQRAVHALGVELDHVLVSPRQSQECLAAVPDDAPHPGHCDQVGKGIQAVPVASWN